jgi:hypothetical protein
VFTRDDGDSYQLEETKPGRIDVSEMVTSTQFEQTVSERIAKEPAKQQALLNENSTEHSPRDNTQDDSRLVQDLVCAVEAETPIKTDENYLNSARTSEGNKSCQKQVNVQQSWVKPEASSKPT